MKKSIWIAVVLVVLAGFFILNGDNQVSGTPIDVYKSPNCGCCVGHVAVLERNDYNPNLNQVSEIEQIKVANNIPRSMWSCHTSFVEGYFVEGHVPMEAIEKLLAERPNIEGIALPGMPAGSPGMPGYKDREWIIYGIKDSKISEFMRI